MDQLSALGTAVAGGAWIAACLTLAILTLWRPAFGFALYAWCRYAAPTSYPWGAAVPGGSAVRWQLLAGAVFAGAVLLRQAGSLKASGPSGFASWWREICCDPARSVLVLLLCFSLDAALVHYAFAADPERSADGLVILLKNSLLALLIYASVRSQGDLRLALLAIVAGTLFLGGDAILFERGFFKNGRLEGIGISNASESNALSGLLVLALPLAAALAVRGRHWERALGLSCAVFALEIVFLGKSRSGHLALAASSVALLWLSNGASRRLALRAILVAAVLAALVAVLPLRVEPEEAPSIASRFAETVEATDPHSELPAAPRQLRILFWTQGLRLIGDHPLGAGFEAAFKSDLGLAYLREVGLTRHRAVHNGFLDVAASWGLPGLALYLGAFILVWRRLSATRVRALAAGQVEAAFLGACLQAAFVGQWVSSLFNSTLDGDWYFWLIGISLAYERLHAARRP